MIYNTIAQFPCWVNWNKKSQIFFQFNYRKCKHFPVRETLFISYRHPFDPSPRRFSHKARLWQVNRLWITWPLTTPVTLATRPRAHRDFFLFISSNFQRSWEKENSFLFSRFKTGRREKRPLGTIPAYSLFGVFKVLR